jgi:hypothetical protein
LAIISTDLLSVVILEAVAVGVIFITGREYKPKFRYAKEQYDLVDWRLNQLEYRVGDEIEITLTNLHKEDIKYDKGTVMWGIGREGDQNVIHLGELDQPISIKEDDSYTWLWRIPRKFEHGIYRVYRAYYNKKGELSFIPLLRKLRIIRKHAGTRHPRKRSAHKRSR